MNKMKEWVTVRRAPPHRPPDNRCFDHNLNVALEVSKQMKAMIDRKNKAQLAKYDHEVRGVNVVMWNEGLVW